MQTRRSVCVFVFNLRTCTFRLPGYVGLSCCLDDLFCNPGSAFLFNGDFWVLAARFIVGVRTSSMKGEFVWPDKVSAFMTLLLDFLFFLYV